MSVQEYVKIGRASGRERVLRLVEVLVGAGAVKEDIGQV